MPHVPEDYIHRVGRTARAEMTGDAFTFVSPEEETDLAAIERAIGKRLPRITVPGFDYAKAPAERFEVPIAERIAAIRARKAEERQRAREKAERARRPTKPRSAPGEPQKASRARPRGPFSAARHVAAGAGHGPSGGPATSGRLGAAELTAPARRFGRRAEPVDPSLRSG